MKLPGRRKKPQPEGRRPAAQLGENTGRSPIYAYRSLRDERGAEPRVTQRSVQGSSKKQLLIRRVTLVLCLLVLLFGLWLKPTPKVTIIKIPGTIARDQAYYETEIRRVWAKKLSNQSKVTIRADKLSRDFMSQFPELETVRVELPLVGQLPNVVVSPGKPVLLLVTQRGAFYVANNGRTMVRSDFVRANELGSIPTVRDDSGLVPEPGKPALPLAQMQTIISVIQLAQEANIDLESVTLPLLPNELDLVVKGSGYTVKFALDQPPEQGIGALIALRNKFKTDGIQPTAYVDLRVPDKAFYK